jgi:hypothetical protein
MAMTTQTNRTHWRALFAGLAAWVGVGCAASNSSSDVVELPAGSPTATGEPATTRAPPPPKSDPPPPSSVVVTAAPAQREPPPSERFEERTGLTLSPVAKAIMDDCPSRAWSKNVPKRRCTKDDQCNDGFCDRGRCAPFWTCTEDYGRPCEQDDHCRSRPCINGRCQSCVSDAECQGQRAVQDPKCVEDAYVVGARECIGVFPSIMPSATDPGLRK